MCSYITQLAHCETHCPWNQGTAHSQCGTMPPTVLLNCGWLEGYRGTALPATTIYIVAALPLPDADHHTHPQTPPHAPPHPLQYPLCCAVVQPITHPVSARTPPRAVG